MKFNAAVVAVVLAATAGPVQAQTPAPKPVTTENPANLGLFGREVPHVLAVAKDSPYAAPENCEALTTEIVRLDQLLGPDVDEKAADRPSAVSRLLGGAIRSAIPYRGVFRWMTGVEKRERQLKEAIVAGTARRAYLKGMSRGMACSPPQTAAAAEVALPPAAPVTAPAETPAPGG